MRCQDALATSPLQQRADTSFTESFAMKEAQWHTEKEMLSKELEKAR